MKDDPALFWKIVKEEMKKQKTTHAQIAKKIGISFNTFQGWIFKGVYPRVDGAVRIAKALNTSVEYLITGITAKGNNKKAIETIRRAVPQMEKHFETVKQAVKELW